MKFVKLVLIILIVNFLSACDDYEEKLQRERCEATPCTDSLCLHWNSILKRCGTEIALLNEHKRVSLERYERILHDNVEIQKRQIEIQERHLHIKDSLFSLFLEVMKKNDESNLKFDSLLDQRNYDVFCEIIKKRNTSLYWMRLLSTEICD